MTNDQLHRSSPDPDPDSRPRPYTQESSACVVPVQTSQEGLALSSELFLVFAGAGAGASIFFMYSINSFMQFSLCYEQYGQDVFDNLPEQIKEGAVVGLNIFIPFSSFAQSWFHSPIPCFPVSHSSLNNGSVITA
ncbi:unnamed protein product [Ambrosiozyma monospora]|uniref:Unnamed protein product n=1 Tax=Ambrosiozyma monospora TaxID=43982 RepID=A0A9W6Z5I5_AMBMO|nr:unnamed protein product [Ambrosiozyma monospora]